MPPDDSIRRRSYTESSLLLKLPKEEHTGNYLAPFQFDRHALGRISTSPTLRRLRMASASQALSLQDRALRSSDTAHLGNQKEYTSSLHHICKSLPQCTKSSSLSSPSCVHGKLLSPEGKTETTIADWESAGPKSRLSSQKDPLSNESPEAVIQYSWKASSDALPERLLHSSPRKGEGFQKSSLPIKRSDGTYHKLKGKKQHFFPNFLLRERIPFCPMNSYTQILSYPHTSLRMLNYTLDCGARHYYRCEI
ncbi:PREDICTED: uncharacterized protein LOC104565860 [Tinamus guttatus]|uniref:uncharacterized protein LOC104565860 n=1 Tax=Tinamus guttatus TaxID=94827 RepID=UPI00052ED0A5|nr:PREDICTED: uncharacterized protein LOC104565860 [Tinamus guttatus]